MQKELKQTKTELSTVNFYILKEIIPTSYQSCKNLKDHISFSTAPSIEGLLQTKTLSFISMLKHNQFNLITGELT